MPDDTDWAVGAPTPQQTAHINRNAGYGVQPQAATQAITQGGPLGIPPSMGMHNPVFVQQQQNDTDWAAGVQQHPPIATFASQSPAHAVAASGSVNQLGAVSTATKESFWDFAGDRWNQAHTAALQAWNDIGMTLLHPDKQTFNIGPFASLPILDVPNAQGPAMALGLSAQHLLGAGLAGITAPIGAAADVYQQDHPGLERKWGRVNIPGTPYYLQFGLKPRGLGDITSQLAQIAIGEAMARGAPRGAPRAQGAPGDTGPAQPGPTSPEAMARQPFHNGTTWNTTADGFLADEEGQPVGFNSPRDAALWRMKNGGDQVFEPDMHGEGIGLRDVMNRPEDPYWTARNARNPVPGRDPQTDEVLSERADHNAEIVANQEKAVANTPMHQQAPGLMREFLEGTDVAGRNAEIDPLVLYDLYRKGEKPFFNRLDDLEDAQFAGRPLVVPMSEYLAEVSGKPWADAVREATNFTDGGISQAEAKEVKDMHVSQGDTSASMTEEPKQGFAIRDLPTYTPDQGEIIDRILAAGDIKPEDVKENPIPRGQIPHEVQYGKDQRTDRELRDKVNAAHAAAKVETVELSKLKSPQRSITGSVAEKAEAKPSESDIRGLRPKGASDEDVHGTLEKYMGEYYVRDGNHRITKLMSEGKTTGRFSVIDLDKHLETGYEEPEAPANRPYEVPKDIPNQFHEPLKTLAAAVDRELDEVFKDNELGRIFENAKAIGMTQAQFQRYGSALDEAKYDMRERVMKKMYDQIKRERTPDWKAAVELATEEATKEIESHQNVQAYRNLKDKLFKLDSATVQRMFPDLANDFPKNLQKIGGTDPDDMAEMLGYSSGGELVKEMVMLQRAMDAVDAKTIDSFVKSSARLLAGGMARELAGFDGSPDGIAREVMEAARGPEMEDFLIKELQAIKNAAGELDLKFDKDKIYGKAEDIFGKMPTKDAANVKFAEKALQKTGRAAEFALEKGNWVAAFKAKQQQLLNLYMLRMTHDFAKDLRSFERVGDQYARRKSMPQIPQEWMDRIHSFLQDYGWKVPQNNLKYNYDQWAEAMRNRPPEEGGPVQVQPYSRPNPTDYTKLPVNDLLDIKDRLDNLVHLAREEGTIKVLDDHLAMAILVQQAVDAAADVKKRPVIADATLTRGKIDASQINAWMFSPHVMIDILDNRNPNGVFNRVLMQGAKHALVTEHDIIGPDEKAITDIIQELGSNEWDRLTRYVPKGHGLMRPDRPGLETNLTYKDLIGIMLHMGNKEGRWHLEEGGWGWDRDKYEALVRQEATPKDWKLVDSIHEAMAKMWPRIVEAERELTGLVPEKVKPTPIIFENLKPGMGHNGGPAIDVEVHDGGYFPLRRDDRISSALKGKPRVDPDSLWAHMLQEGATPKGHTIKRVAASYVPSLDWMNTIQTHIPNVAKRIAYGKWALDALKFLSQPEIVQLIEDVHGPYGHAVLRGWLQRQLGYRTIDPRAPAGLDGVMRELRLRTYSTVAALKVSIAFEHGTSIAQTAAQAGFGTTARGLLRWLSNPNQAYEFAEQSSPYMKIRSEAVTRELRDIIDDIHNNRSTILPYIPLVGRVRLPVADPAMVKIREYSNKFFAWFNQYVAATPAWIGAYHDARAGKAVPAGRLKPLPAMDHDEAVDYADKVVQKSHGSGFEMDMGTFQSGGGNELLKTANMWNVFRGTFGSLMREGAYHAFQGQDIEEKLAGWKQLLIAALTVTTIAKIVTDHLPKDAKDFVWWMLDNTLDGLSHMAPFGPNSYQFLKNVGQRVEGKNVPLDFSVSPVEGAITTSGQGAVDVLGQTQKHKPKDSRAIENSAFLLGMLFHIPGASQIGETLQSIHDMGHPPAHKGRVTRPWQAAVFGPSHERPQK